MAHMFRDFLLKKMLERQLAGSDLGEAEKEKLLTAISKDPELFATIAKEAEAAMKNGQSQMTAIMNAAKAHQDELKKLLS
jgi:hypothetical protein